MTEGPASLENPKRKRGQPKKENMGGTENMKTEDLVEGRRENLNNRTVWNVYLGTGEEYGIEVIKIEQSLGKDVNMDVRNKKKRQN